MTALEPLDRHDHRYYQDLVGGAALGILTQEEHAELMAHLQTCAECREDFAEMRDVVGVLPLSLDDASPSPALRDRIQMLVEQDASAPTTADAAEWGDAPHDEPTPLDIGDAQADGLAPEPAPARLPRRRRLELPANTDDFVPLPVEMVRQQHRRPPAILWGVAALLVVAVIAGALLGRAFLADNGGKTDEGEQIALQFTTPVPDVSAQLTYFADRQLLVLKTEHMPPPPADHVYQVWLIGGAGPVPVGTMQDGGYATVADISRYQTFAITVEPGPLGSDQPTTEPIVVAPLDNVTVTAS